MDEKINENQLEEIFDEDKLDKAIKKGKQKSIKRTVFISIVVAALVFILITVGNFALTINMSNKAYQRMSAYVKLTVPNGYISKSVDTIGFLGGRSDFTISRTVGDKPVILGSNIYSFGFLPQKIMSRQQGGGSHVAGQWPTHYWEYGYERMVFFHPDITYKKYKNDLTNINQISSDQLIEVGLSLDKSYTFFEISKILPDVNISWYWINSYSSEDMENYEREVKEYDAEAAYIPEFEVLGVNMRLPVFDEFASFASSYNNFLFNLKVSENSKFIQVYNELNAKGYIDPSKVPLLGVTVVGTKEELNSLIGNPHIKASSLGVITNKY